MDSFQGDIHLRDYIGIINRRKGVAAAFFILVVALVAVGNYVITPVYRATTTIMIDLESPNMLTVTDSVSLGPQNYYAYKEYYQSQQEIIKSRRIANEVFGEFKLIEKPWYRDAEEPIDAFIETITVQSVRDTRLVKLHAENRDPALAASIANRIAELYVKQNLDYISRGEYLNLLKNEYLKLNTRLEEESKVFKGKHPNIVRLNERIAQMAAKIEEEKEKTGVDINEVMDITLGGLKANNVRVLDYAEAPKTPIRPDKLLNILLAIFVGLFGGVGLTFFAEYLDTTVKSERDIERHIKMPFLGTVPRIESEKGMRRLSEKDKDIICHVAPNSIVAEAYRVIRTNILFALGQDKGIKDIIVTSPGPKEGKTTTACNLAIAIANLGHKVLLIDADLRKPRLHTVFEVENENGLSGILSNKGISLSDAVKETKVENLSLVTAGQQNENPAEKLSSRWMKDLIQNARKNFDFVLIDTPPIAVVTDAAILAGFVGGVIVVAEGGKTVKDILSRADRLLKKVKAEVIGVIVNNITRTDCENPYYYSNYYYSDKK